jgi:hypothetical protein
MSFLRRLLGGEARSGASATPSPDPSDGDTGADAEELHHELDLLRGEQERLDELMQRQLRYAQYAWQPPAQGGERRADDPDSRADGR